MAQVYDYNNVSLLSNWINPNEPSNTAAGNKYSGVWGWHDAVKNKEYALIGSATGTYFIDVTNPYMPVQKAFLAGASAVCTWREIKSYSHYAYIVSDVCTPNAFQIVDMQYLPDSIHIVMNDASLLARGHTLNISGNKLYVASPKEGLFPTPALIAVFDLTNPESPQLLRTLDEDVPPNSIVYVHDMFVRNDTVFASAGNQGLLIYSFLNNQFTPLGILAQYDNAGFNHSSWLTDNGKYAVMCDETAKTSVKVADLQDFSNLSVVGNFISDPDTGAIHHNPFVVGNDKVIVSSYKDGIQIFDISDPSAPFKTGFFDTYPQNGSTYTGYDYQGCWGAYPYLPSKITLASDMQNGLFILDAKIALGLKTDDKQQINVSLFPNPTSDFVKIKFDNGSTKYNIEILNVLGQIIFTKNDVHGSENINLLGQSSGIYTIRIGSSNNISTHKVVKN